VVYSKTEIIEQDAIPAKQVNMVFGGTLVAYGRGIMVVTHTGDIISPVYIYTISPGTKSFFDILIIFPFLSTFTSIFSVNFDRA
ncbi:hypothetical protein ACTPEF_23350, partial [Clostridioides difficile]